jgi:hypothetical protein
LPQVLLRAPHGLVGMNAGAAGHGRSGLVSLGRRGDGGVVTLDVVLSVRPAAGARAARGGAPVPCGARRLASGARPRDTGRPASPAQPSHQPLPAAPAAPAHPQDAKPRAVEFANVFAFFTSSKVSAPLDAPRGSDGRATGKPSFIEAATARAAQAAKAPLAENHCWFCNTPCPSARYHDGKRLCGACSNAPAQLPSLERPGRCPGGCAGCARPEGAGANPGAAKKRKAVFSDRKAKKSMAERRRAP